MISPRKTVWPICAPKRRRMRPWRRPAAIGIRFILDAGPTRVAAADAVMAVAVAMVAVDEVMAAEAVDAAVAVIASRTAVVTADVRVSRAR